jgi:pyruvate/2-oxoglutarate dehydrogenase complex dihydrolipoamide dehydrogenase (E3) component
VIGSGVAGKLLGWALPKQGQRTLVVERPMVGADDRIPGFTEFGAEASELKAVAQTAMLGGMPYTVLRDTIWTHPTAAEGLLGLFAPPRGPAGSP